MRSVAVIIVSSVFFHSTLARVVCDKSPPPFEQIPRLQDCYDLIDDIFAISKLEDDEKITWSHTPQTMLGTRKLPFHFTAPSVNNDCQFLVDSFKEDQEDMFSIYDVGLTAREVVKSCLEPKAGGVETIGAEVVGPKKVMVVVLLRKIPDPPRNIINPAIQNVTDRILRLPGYAASMYADLVRTSQS